MLLALLTISLVTITTAQTCISPTSECICYIEGTTQKKIISCRYQNLTAVPTFTPSTEIFDKIEFTSVEATGTCSSSQICNNIRNVPGDAFKHLKVREIDLRSNAVTSFDINAFQGLENVLESLLVEGDGVIAPPYSSLAPLRILKSLHLEHFNQGEFNTVNTRLSFPTLTSLTIEYFPALTSMRSAAFRNVNNIENLKLQRLPSLVSLPVLTILSFSKLKTLDIYETGIRQILGESFKGLNFLTSLEIKSNKYLTSIIDNAFEGVSNTITFLSLFQNALSSFNFLSQTSWPQLTQLNIGYNIARVSSGTFATMPNLSYLTMADMGLQTITRDMLTGLTNLYTLDLAYNLLTHIPADVFQNTPKLKELRLNNQNENDATSKLSFDNATFEGIEASLQYLMIQNNKIDDGQFWNKIENMVNLLDLNLAETGLTSIPNYAFRNNVKLEKLDLALNNIKSVQQETFIGPRDTLQSINLYGNKIQTVDNCVLSQFNTQPEIYLTGNPLHCDYKLIWLWKLVQGSSTLAFTHVGLCATPSSLANKYFTEFQVTALAYPPNFHNRSCQVLYSTPTATTIITTATQSSTTAKLPTPSFTVAIVHKEATKMTVAWSVSDRTYVTEYKLEIITDDTRFIQLIHKDETEVVVANLKPWTLYQFCLILQIEGVFRESEPRCVTGSSLGLQLNQSHHSTPRPAIDACISSPCKNGGSCETLPGTFHCYCAPGYDGRSCDHDYDECRYRPCKNGGTCSNTDNGFRCACGNGFTGERCETHTDCAVMSSHQCWQIAVLHMCNGHHLHDECLKKKCEECQSELGLSLVG